MPLAPGDRIELSVESAAAGGRMVARHDGLVVLVLGAVPGERVVARVERVEKRLAFASTVSIVERSADRRDVDFDPRCGGCVYAHIAYPRQVALKSQVISDALVRIGRIPLEQPVHVASSPEHGYRMRARLHVRDGRAGFYLEGTHDLCDGAATRQMLPETLDAVHATLREAADKAIAVAAVEVSENIAADERAMHLELDGGGHAEDGDESVADPVAVLTDGRATTGEVRRRPTSFFQGNRYLLPRLVTTVLDSVLPDGEVLDLYAGVGLFSIPLAATGRGSITAVEGDGSAGADLRLNASACGGAVRAIVGPVEHYLSRQGLTPSSVIVDPPRTGLSRSAMTAIVRHGARRVVYVSCDPATMARDSRRLLDAGYRLVSLEGFDLFPNTPHVEALGVFDLLT